MSLGRFRASSFDAIVRSMNLMPLSRSNSFDGVDVLSQWRRLIREIPVRSEVREKPTQQPYSDPAGA
jgi:hypothetical protein